ncbi:hypothetical protein N9D45_05695 [Gammaproteobacteria bacterium]|jgi:5'(3')-deoxyribonucleotidase|nr:hypothetical protein [Gammaproteobacteria bacterium]
MKKILYVDMDNVLVDYPSGKMTEQQIKDFTGEHLDDFPVIFAQMLPIEGAIDAFNELSIIFDTYILSTAPWNNNNAWSDKVFWVKKYLGKNAEKRLILTHNKHLNFGDFLIDDRLENGAGKFKGELIHFLHDERFLNWGNVLAYLKTKA